LGDFVSVSGCVVVCGVEEVRCGREERVVERILAEEDKRVVYRSETRRPR
jgi:hypothetical protein